MAASSPASQGSRRCSRGSRGSWRSRSGVGAVGAEAAARSEEYAPLGLALRTGLPNFGGPVATAGGLVFIGAAADRYLRAFEAASGAELWRGRLPAVPMATPMTYAWHGRQFVVVAAGGHSDIGLPTGDAVVAFALPIAGEPGRSVWDRTVDQPGGRFVARVAGLAALLAWVAWVVAFAVRRRRRRR